MTCNAFRWATSASICFILISLAGIRSAGAQTKEFNVPAQSATTGIPEFAHQAGIQILVSETLVRGKRTATVTGSLAVEKALEILLAGTGLTATSKDGATFTLSATPTPPTSLNTPVPTASNSGTTSDQSGPKKDSNSFSTETGKPGLSEIIVTGSRLHQDADNRSYELLSYSNADIDQSGQTTVTDFLNSLPQVSTTMDSSGFQGTGRSTGVRLHGLPLGTTLVLIDGQRVALPGGPSGNTIFDLSNIPLAAVDHIEVVPVGSSAVYGSDAIGGVVNVVMKKNIDGLHMDLRYGGASGTDTYDASLAWGSPWETGGVTLVADYRSTSPLAGSDRAITASGDMTAFGGPDNRFNLGNPANIYSVDGGALPGLTAPFASVPKGFKGTPSVSEFAGTSGQLNTLSLYSTLDLIPRSDQASAVASFHQEIASSTEVFGQLLVSQLDVKQNSLPPFLFGIPGYQQYTVSASNPYNPFGQTVGVGYYFNDNISGVDERTTFLQPTIGLRGSVLDKWHWEIAGLWSDQYDRALDTNQLDSSATQAALDSTDPSTALNLFNDAPPGSPASLRSLFYDITDHYRTTRGGVNGFISGPAAQLPGGPIAIVLGAEFLRDRLRSTQDDPTNPSAANPLGTASDVVSRSTASAFAELSAPLLRPYADGRDTLALNVAGRYDHYSDFGGKTTPQAGLIWRPVRDVAIRGTWSRSFKAPTLLELNQQQTTVPQALTDPLTGQQVVANVTNGGNPKLQPETGESHSIGVDYDSSSLPGLKISVSQWRIDEHNSIQSIGAQTILDNGVYFPGAVSRAADCVNGPPCPVTAVTSGYENFGEIQVEGVDYDASYTMQSPFGQVRLGAMVAEMYKYTAAFQPGEPATNRLSEASDDFNWAPRWKGTLTAGWSVAAFSLNSAGRYTGKYRDYEPLVTGNYQELGNFWFFDLNARCDIARLLGTSSRTLHGAYVEFGGVNVFNKLPQFSMLDGGRPGYDFMQGDIRGRFLYIQIGGSL